MIVELPNPLNQGVEPSGVAVHYLSVRNIVYNVQVLVMENLYKKEVFYPYM